MVSKSKEAPSVTALFVDDEKTLREQYIENLQIALRTECGIEVSFDSVNKIEEAKNALQRGQRRYKLVVVDMLWPGMGNTSTDVEPRGLEVVRQAAKTKGVTIVAISVGDSRRFPTLQEEALDAGAHIFRLKGAVQSQSRVGGWEELARAICQKLRERRAVNSSGGPNSADAGRVLGYEASRIAKRNRRAVFVVHGRNDAVTNALYEFLRALDLAPYEWEDLTSRTAKEMGTGGNPPVLDIIKHGFSISHGAVVLFTPDDEVRLKKDFRKPSDERFEFVLCGQPRPNVLFEAGFALGCNAAHTLIISVGKCRQWSDLAGKHLVHLKDNAASRKDVAQRLEAMNFAVNMAGGKWLEAGDFG